MPANGEHIGNVAFYLLVEEFDSSSLGGSIIFIQSVNNQCEFAINCFYEKRERQHLRSILLRLFPYNNIYYIYIYYTSEYNGLLIKFLPKKERANP